MTGPGFTPRPFVPSSYSFWYPVLLPFVYSVYCVYEWMCAFLCMYMCVCVCVVLVYVWEIIMNKKVFLLYNMVHFMKDIWLKWCNKRREWPALPGVAREALTHECGIVNSEGCSRKRKKNDDVIYCTNNFF